MTEHEKHTAVKSLVRLHKITRTELTSWEQDVDRKRTNRLALVAFLAGFGNGGSKGTGWNRSLTEEEVYARREIAEALIQAVTWTGYESEDQKIGEMREQVLHAFTKGWISKREADKLNNEINENL